MVSSRIQSARRSSSRISTSRLRSRTASPSIPSPTTSVAVSPADAPAEVRETVIESTQLCNGRKAVSATVRLMDLGVLAFVTSYSLPVTELARGLEARGFEALFATENTHIHLPGDALRGR